MAELLLKKGADVDGRDDHGRTALCIAAEMDHRSVVELLLENGADVTVRDFDGEPVIHKIVWSGDDSIFEILLRHGADVDARRDDGATALYMAACLGFKSKVQLLINAANLEATTEYNGLQFTASDIAKEIGDVAVFELLQEAREQRKTLPIRHLSQSHNLLDESNSPAD